MFYRLPNGVLKYYKGDYEYDDETDAESGTGSDLSRVSSVSSYRSSFSDGGSFTLSENLEPTPISGVTLVHTTNTANESTSYFPVPRKTRFIKAKNATTRVISTFVDHIYSSVYIPGRTVRGARSKDTGQIKKKKPTIAPKPDIVPMVDRREGRKDGKDKIYDKPCTDSTSSEKVRFSIPLYQNIVKYNKINKDDQVSVNESPVGVKQGKGLFAVHVDVRNPKKTQSKDSGGYLVPEKLDNSGSLKNDATEQYL